MLRNFTSNVEAALLPLAKAASSERFDTRAVIGQWSQAIASNTSLFLERSLLAGEIQCEVSSSLLVDTLKSHGLFDSRSSFCESLLAEINIPPPAKPDFQFIDLFAGIGGFRIALQKQNGACVFSSEWDKSAQNTYYENYGEFPFGDITAFTAEDIDDATVASLIPTHDVLAAGFPCQPFSHAGVSARTSVGKAHGFLCRTQGTLFFDVMRIAAAKRPKVLFLENVRNIQRHDGGRTFEVIRESIEELGYDFKFTIVDSSTLVPQRRKRCYMICFRKDLNVDYVFPDFSGEPLPLRTILEDSPDDKYTISDRLWEGHQNRTKRNLARGTGFTAFTADLDKPSNTLVARYGKDGKECLVPQQGKNPRFLTPRECARLQGYPEEFLIPTAKTPAYKQFGNSVSVPVIIKLAESIRRHIV